MACGDPGDAKCAGIRTVSTPGVMAPSEFFFKPLVAGDQKASLASLSPQLCPFWHLQGFLTWGPSLLFSGQAHRAPLHPLPGVLLCRSGHRALNEAPWVGSYSVVQGVRRLMGQPLYCSAADAGVWRERLW